ncbi:MAG TPA: type II toxin-antitoxin system mRNA interferase toxin, RelE/StbE family [Coxiellaceae bacterium]|nr:type II toxin-antitoxin system mRNA interferase toxin, RelE/StbE family [Coxiellaceae bacterium]
MLYRIPKHILKQYELWKRIVELQGPNGLREIRGFHDEPLKGDWQGFRSSRLNRKWRVIYAAEDDVCEIYVVDINPHQY